MSTDISIRHLRLDHALGSPHIVVSRPSSVLLLTSSIIHQTSALSHQPSNIFHLRQITLVFSCSMTSTFCISRHKVSDYFSFSLQFRVIFYITSHISIFHQQSSIIHHTSKPSSISHHPSYIKTPFHLPSSLIHLTSSFLHLPSYLIILLRIYTFLSN